MLADIYDWIKNIAFYIILITTVMNVLPNKKYQKYLKLLVGALMMMIIISPLSELFHFNGSFDLSFIKNAFEQESRELSENVSNFNSVKNSRLKEVYEEEIVLGVKEIFESHQLYVNDYSIIYNEDLSSEDFGNIEELNITAGKKEDKITISIEKISPQDEYKADTPEEIQIKKEIENFYNIPISNINISIQE